MLFQTAGIEVAPWIPPLVAFVISFFTSMGGVSGAYRYIKEGRMVWPLTWAVIIGTLPGVFIGAIVRVRYLPDPKNFKMFVGLVLLYIGGKMVKDLLQKKRSKGGHISAEEQFQKRIQEYRKLHQTDNSSEQVELAHVIVKKLNFSRIIYEFYGQTFDISTLGIMSLCFIVGIIGGVYGIGGGSIVAPFFISFFCLPVYTIAGAALFNGNLCNLSSRRNFLSVNISILS
jgi:hypothetical protein